MKFPKGCRPFPILNTVDFDGVHGDVIFTDNDAEVFDFRDFKLALLRFEVEIIFGQDAKYVIDNPSVEVYVIWCMDEDVIHVNGDVAFVDQFAKDEVHHGLERGRGIRETEKHDHGLEKAAVRFKGGFPLVAVSNTYVVVSPSDV